VGTVLNEKWRLDALLGIGGMAAVYAASHRNGVADGCGGNVACGGACALPQSCGGGGAANVCGCTPTTCVDWGCGTHPNGCGVTLNCGTCGGGGSCFPAGTRVTMADGSHKAIESIHEGDLVRSPDPRTGAMGVARVVAAKVHPSALSREGIVVVDGALRATRNHPIWVNGAVVAIEEIRAGDTILVSDPSGRTLERQVQTVALEPGGVVTYDLVLAGGAYYFAGGVVIQQKQIP
jgi:hypothetical protein